MRALDSNQRLGLRFNSLIKDLRATGLNVYIDEPYPQIAEAPPVIVASSFSSLSLF